MQCAFQVFVARTILRHEIRAFFVQEFDPKRHFAVYRNTFSGDKSLREPFKLRSVELKFPAQWSLLEALTCVVSLLFPPGEFFSNKPASDGSKLGEAWRVSTLRNMSIHNVLTFSNIFSLRWTQNLHALTYSVDGLSWSWGEANTSRFERFTR